MPTLSSNENTTTSKMFNMFGSASTKWFLVQELYILKLGREE